MTQIRGKHQGLVFEIASARICEIQSQKENEKSVIEKYVIYTIQVRFLSGHEDLSPSILERRYTHFANLYNGLKKDYGQLMGPIQFPRKVLVGNFDNDVISTRSTSFENLLQFIIRNPTLQGSKYFLDFLQLDELNRARQLIEDLQYLAALPILEASFRLLNKVYMDRSAVVLLSLGRLVGCSYAILSEGPATAQKWSGLMFQRYESVSDGDLLQLYVPLLHICIEIATVNKQMTEIFKQRLEKLKEKGVNTDLGPDTPPFLSEVNKIEKLIFKR